jgi:hypothetical protein
MNVPSQLALKTHTNVGCAGSLATLDKLYFGQPTDIVIKKKGMWPSCVERYTPKLVSQ